MMRPCVDCGEPTNEARCDVHGRQVEARRHNPIYDDPRWKRLRKRVKARHIKRHGYMCPGYSRDPHLAAVLHADHRTPVHLGGAPFLESNVQVLCGDCNARKGSRPA